MFPTSEHSVDGGNQSLVHPPWPFTKLWTVVAVVLISAAIFVGCIVSPPSLMDDVDAVQAQIAKTMLTSGDWVTARLDGVPYLEKAPLLYWAIAISYEILGVHDWAARIPIALASVGLAWLTAAFGIWAFGLRGGFYSGLCVATCVGLFLFTRILIPDVILTLSIALAMWSFLRTIEDGEPHPKLWAFLLAASLGVGLLLKSLIGVVFPIGAGLVYLVCTRQLLNAATWRRLRPFSGTLIAFAIAAPWHILAIIQNPPYFAFTMRSAPGEYHGFFWFYFINEQLLRFLNLRYPHDYNTVPRLYFWLFHLLWLFPWSVYFPAIAKLSFRPSDRAGRTRLLALCWVGFVMVFFTFSTTQEYYSMPIYPALALLIGSALASGGVWISRGTRLLAGLAGVVSVLLFVILFLVRHLPTPGDIAQALTENPGVYTLSLGHVEDLTLKSFAYLRLPLAVAAVAFLVGCLGNLKASSRRPFLASGLMMLLFFHAARLALVVFDPYMSSRPIADALNHCPRGRVVINHHYYEFSSVFFYTGRDALLLNGRFNNLVYGSYAPASPPVFIDDAGFRALWSDQSRAYFVVDGHGLTRIRHVIPGFEEHVVIRSGGKYLLTNHPIASAEHSF